MVIEQVAFFHHGQTPHLSQAALLVRSVKRFHPKLPVVQVSSKETPDVIGCDKRLTLHDCSRFTLMVDNIRAQKLVMDATGKTTLFVDTDVLVNRPLADAWPKGDWSVGVTWRPPNEPHEKAMPYNYGVMVLRPTSGTAKFLGAMQESIENMPRGDQSWYGNQKALARILGDPRLPYQEAMGVMFHLAPCGTHNRTPASPYEDLPHVYLLHFKGQRKGWMEVFNARCA